MLPSRGKPNSSRTLTGARAHPDHPAHTVLRYSPATFHCCSASLRPPRRKIRNIPYSGVSDRTGTFGSGCDTISRRLQVSNTIYGYKEAADMSSRRPRRTWNRDVYPVRFSKGQYTTPGGVGGWRQRPDLGVTSVEPVINPEI
jgi:hypothetical protein